ncbi:MAG: MoaD/ThiS family protein [Nitrososphaerales archaeon]
MRIKVKYLSRANDITKKHYEEVDLPDNSTLKDLANILIERYGKDFKDYLYDDSERLVPLIFINKKSVNDLNYPIKEGSEIVFMAAIGGGKIKEGFKLFPP